MARKWRQRYNKQSSRGQEGGASKDYQPSNSRGATGVGTRGYSHHQPQFEPFFTLRSPEYNRQRSNTWHPNRSILSRPPPPPRAPKAQLDHYPSSTCQLRDFHHTRYHATIRAVFDEGYQLHYRLGKFLDNLRGLMQSDPDEMDWDLTAQVLIVNDADPLARKPSPIPGKPGAASTTAYDTGRKTIAATPATSTASLEHKPRFTEIVWASRSDAAALQEPATETANTAVVPMRPISEASPGQAEKAVFPFGGCEAAGIVEV
jgi:hypothetical protein